MDSYLESEMSSLTFMSNDTTGTICPLREYLKIVGKVVRYFIIQKIDWNFYPVGMEHLVWIDLP